MYSLKTYPHDPAPSTLLRKGVHILLGEGSGIYVTALPNVRGGSLVCKSFVMDETSVCFNLLTANYIQFMGLDVLLYAYVQLFH